MAILEKCALKLHSGGRRLVRRVLFVPDPLVVVLRLGWVALVVWGEIGVFFYDLAGCRWPVPDTGRPKSTFGIPSWGHSSATTRVLLLADAQVSDPRTLVRKEYWLAGMAYFAELSREVYLRRAWRATRHLHPNVVLFLGDMLKTGRSVRSDEEFAAYVDHFKRFFLRSLDPGVEVRYIPGNVDVGLGVSSTFSKHVRQRYEHHFGRPNQHLAVANHSLVLLDAPGIVDEDYTRAGYGTSFEEWIPLRDGPIEFIKGFTAEEQQGPTILFSHIPLHRAESRQCGPLRERGTIQRGVGHGWQKTLGKQTSAFLLESLHPTIVFSADDRDYCDVTHALPGSGGEIHEITVKSFSPARHISRPGLHLLSLAGGPSPAHAHMPCLLPRTEGTPLRLYVPALCLTVLVLLVAHMRRASHAARLRLTTPASPLPSHADPHPHAATAAPSPLQAAAVPSPYSASSAYSYSYAYSNTPPSGSQPRRERIQRPTPLPPPTTSPRTAAAAPPLALASPPPLPPTQEEEGEQEDDDDDGDGVRAHYLYMPPAAPLPGDLLARRQLSLSTRSASPDRAGVATGPPPRAWSFTYAFTFRGRRRRLAMQAPAWWPRRGGAAGGAGGGAARRRRRREEVWSAAGRDFGRVIGTPIVMWVLLLWLC